MLLGRGHWQPDPELLVAQFKRYHFKPIDWSDFPRGIDNVRIDVIIDGKLDEAIESLVLLSLAKYLKPYKIFTLPAAGSVHQDVRQLFRQTYAELSLAAAEQAKARSQREFYQLFVFAVLKHIYLTVDAKLKEYREGLEQNDPNNEQKGPSKEKLALFNRKYRQLRFAIAQEVVEQWHTLESLLRKRRKSIIALSWPVAEEILFNPLLHLLDFSSEESFALAYPLFLIEHQSFCQFEHLLHQIIKPFVPYFPCEDQVQNRQRDLSQVSLRNDSGVFPGYAQVESYLRHIMPEEEYRDMQLDWYDQPQNILWLFDMDAESPSDLPWDYERWQQFQNQRLHELEKKLKEQKLLKAIAASQILPELYPKIEASGIPYHTLLDYLCGHKKKDIPPLPRIYRDQISESDYQHHLEQAYQRIQQASSEQWRQWIISTLEGYARLRRDLKLAWQAYRAMDNIHLLFDPDEIKLSQANQLLHRFVVRRVSSENQVQGHVIIKADLRGSTDLIDRMLDANLNPAAYFSENLFDPITRLLERYGAEKIFVEGDAVILMILEEKGKPGQVISRACGLAYDIIHLLKQRNQDNRRAGLPLLELGIGIAYLDASPNYLFDGGHRIVISPAINTADRLSSCSKQDFKPFRILEKKQGVELIMQHHEHCGDTLFRFNINGIELDEASFKHLRRQEITLHKIRLTSSEINQHDRYYIGRFTDLLGKMRWMVIRKAVIRHWDGKYIYHPDKPAYYYELVVDETLVHKIRRELKKRKTEES